MIKKFATVCIAVICLSACAFGLAACGNGDDHSSIHIHNYQWVDNGDGTHKQHCLVASCDTPDIHFENHVWGTDGKCEKCKAAKPNDEHLHDYKQKYDETFHWLECSAVDCDEKIKDKQKHDTLGTGGTCSVCGYSKSLLLFKTLQIGDNDTVYGKVSNATETFSFIKEITIKDGVTYTVSSDITGNQTIPTKTVPLDIGDNMFYILAQYKDSAELFTVTIRRRPMYSVTYMTDGGTDCVRQQVEEDGLATEPTTDKTGYTFLNWDYDHATPITADTTITANWVANRYAVTLDANGGEAETDIQSITYDSGYSLPLPTRTGYSFTGWYDGDIQMTDSDGISLSVSKFAAETTFTAHWQINRYRLTVQADNSEHGAVRGNSGTYDYNTEVSVAATTHLGYTFIGWFDGDIKLSESKDFAFSCPAKDTILTAKWATNSEMRNFTFSSSMNTCTITGVKDKTVPDITIPDYITGIGTSAFYGCSRLTSMEIPSGIKSIESYTFDGCNSLMRIEIPSSVTSIGDGAFYGCGSLTSITIPSSVTSIGNSAFSGCSSLKNITIPFIYKFVSPYEYPFGYFFGASSYEGGVATKQFVRDVRYGTGNERIYYIPLSLKSVTILGRVTSIKYQAFRNCSGLTDITIPSSVTSIGDSTFKGCSGLTSITIPSSVTSIGNSAFEGCSGLTSIEIPSSVTSIGDSAFSGCSGLTSIGIPVNATQIWSGAFSDCSGLTSIEIPSSVTSIKYQAFRNCSGLTDITIPSGVTSIGNSAFEGCSSLASIEIPSGVTSIGNSAFKGCSGLTSIEIPSGIKSIESYTFDGCSGLTSMEIPNSVTSIGDYTFRSCSSLTSMTIPSSVTSIGTSVFLNCSSLTTVNWNITACTTTSPIFGNCTKLTTIIIGDTVTDIPQYAFKCCSGLTSIEIPNSVTSIGKDAFSGCSGLTSVEIPNSVTYIGYDAFSGCSSLTTVNWNATACKKAGDSTSPIFGDCTKLTTVIIGDTVTNIPACAFSGCSSLTNISIPNGVTSIGEYAFRGCSGLISITIPDSITSIIDLAFEHCDNLTVRCKAQSKPSGWGDAWYIGVKNVVWGYQEDE